MTQKPKIDRVTYDNVNSIELNDDSYDIIKLYYAMSDVNLTDSLNTKDSLMKKLMGVFFVDSIFLISMLYLSKLSMHYNYYFYASCVLFSLSTLVVLVSIIPKHYGCVGECPNVFLHDTRLLEFTKLDAARTYLYLMIDKQNHIDISNKQNARTSIFFEIAITLTAIAIILFSVYCIF